MTDKTETTSATPDQPGRPPLPRTMRLALIGVGVQLGLALVYVLMFSAIGKTLQHEVITSNAKASAKNHKVLCSDQQVKGCLDVPKVVHSAQVSTAIGTIIVVIAIGMLALRIRQGSRLSRNFYIGISILIGLLGFPGSPIGLVELASGGPGPLRAVSAVAGAASITAIVLLLRPEAKAFFDSVSPRPAGVAADRPTLGSLLRPRPPVNRAPAPSGSSKPATTKPANDSSPAQKDGRSAKSKSRNDAESVARGAELARNRAKAAKSRRTE